MGNKPIISEEEKKKNYLALESKANEPGITYDDLFGGINDIHPSYKKEIFCLSIPIAVVFFLSLYAIIFKPSASNWYVCGLIGYILCSFSECGTLFYYKKRYMSIIFIAVFICIGWVAINRTINADMLKDLLQLIKGIFS